MTQKKPDYEAARALVVEERSQRAKACWDEIQKVLEKHNCDMSGVPQFTESPAGYTIITQLRVFARDD